MLTRGLLKLGGFKILLTIRLLVNLNYTLLELF
jgi:hypothetical protein